MAGVGPTLVEFGRDASGYLGAWAAKQLFGAGVDAFVNKKNATPADAANRSHAALHAAKRQVERLNPDQNSVSWDDEATYLQHLKLTPYSQIAGTTYGDLPGYWGKQVMDPLRRQYTPVDIVGNVIVGNPDKFDKSDKQKKPGPKVAKKPTKVITDDYIEKEEQARRSQFGYTTSTPREEKWVPKRLRPGYKEKDEREWMPLGAMELLSASSSRSGSPTSLSPYAPPPVRKPFSPNQGSTVPPEKSQYGYSTGTTPEAWLTPRAKTSIEPHQIGSQRQLLPVPFTNSVSDRRNMQLNKLEATLYPQLAPPSQFRIAEQQRAKERIKEFQQGKIGLATPFGTPRKTYDAAGGLGGEKLLEELAATYDPKTGLYGSRPKLPTIPKPNSIAPRKPQYPMNMYKQGPDLREALTGLEDKWKGATQQPFEVRQRKTTVQARQDAIVARNLAASKASAAARAVRKKEKEVAKDEEKLLKANRKLKAEQIKEQDAKEAVRIIEKAVVVPPKTKKQIREEREKLHNPVARAEAKAKAPKVKKAKKVVPESLP